MQRRVLRRCTRAVAHAAGVIAAADVVAVADVFW
jgi:hypothetical protein